MKVSEMLRRKRNFKKIFYEAKGMQDFSTEFYLNYKKGNQKKFLDYIRSFYKNSTGQLFILLFLAHQCKSAHWLVNSMFMEMCNYMLFEIFFIHIYKDYVLCRMRRRGWCFMVFSLLPLFDGFFNFKIRKFLQSGNRFLY